MSTFFQTILHQLLRELGMPVSQQTTPATGATPQAHQIAELGAWIKKNIVARARDLLARIKVAVGAAGRAGPSAHNAPAAAPDSEQAPASSCAPSTVTTEATPIREQTPASTSATFGEIEPSEEERHELNAPEQDDGRATRNPGSTSRSMRRSGSRQGRDGHSARA